MIKTTVLLSLLFISADEMGPGAVARAKLSSKIQCEKSFDNETLEEVLLWMHDQIGVFFLFDNEIFDKSGRNVEEMRGAKITICARKGITFQRFLDSVLIQVEATSAIDDMLGVITIHPAQQGNRPPHAANKKKG